jgi:hypothetical protein
MKLDNKNEILDISSIDDCFNLQDRHDGDTFFTDPELLNDLKIDGIPKKSIKIESSNPVIQKYKHKGQNSLYWMAPNTKSIYLLDFKKQKFVEEKVDS